MLPTFENSVVSALFRQDPDWRVPALWRSEFRHVLLKYVRSGLIDSTQALAMWQKAFDRFALQENAIEAVSGYRDATRLTDQQLLTICGSATTSAFAAGGGGRGCGRERP